MENRDFIEFLGWEGSYAKFRIKKGQLPNGRNLERIIVAHEGNWTKSDGKWCYREYDAYEDVQKALGEGLTFVSKEYSAVLKRSLISYSFEYGREAVLAVPATGGGNVKFLGKYLAV